MYIQQGGSKVLIHPVKSLMDKIEQWYSRAIYQMNVNFLVKITICLFPQSGIVGDIVCNGVSCLHVTSATGTPLASE